MYSDWVWFLLGLAIFSWLMVLSFLIWQQNGFLKSLFPKSGERDIRKKFEDIAGVIDQFKEELVRVDSRVVDVEVNGLKHIQRVKLLRYNPYDETGGDQSFSVAALDGHGTGIVLTSLHARSGTRVFAKPVVLGLADKYEFSKEEKEIIKETLSSKK